MTASLYVHIPFCVANNGGGVCDYCDFFSVAVDTKKDTALLDSFIEILLNDIEEQIAFFNVDYIPTVYIGGGTPSALGAKRIERLLSGLQKLSHFRKAPFEMSNEKSNEITIEANPESADEPFLQACVSGGVNRISMGVQSFHEPSRQAVRRAGGRDLLEQRLALAADYFPGGLSADLITGLPFQTVSVLAQDIERLLAFRPAHVSLYSLTVDPETALGRKVSRLGAVKLSLPEGDEADSLWLAGRELLEKAGLIQYEVSNFSLPDKTCVHNQRYWRMENWLGAGPAASGTIIDDEAGIGRRFTYPRDVNAYLAAAAPRIHSAAVEEISRAGLIRESLLMGFRCRGGPDPELFKRRFGKSIEDCIPQTIERWRGRNFFEHGGLPPSREGLLFLNAFLRDAFSELD